MEVISFTKRYFFIFLVLLCTFDCCTQRVVFTGAHTAAAEAASGSQSGTGRILLTPYLGHGCSQEYDGWVTQKYGRRSALLFSLGSWPWISDFILLNPNRMVLSVMDCLLVGSTARAKSFDFPVRQFSGKVSDRFKPKEWRENDAVVPFIDQGSCGKNTQRCIGSVSLMILCTNVCYKERVVTIMVYPATVQHEKNQEDSNGEGDTLNDFEKARKNKSKHKDTDSGSGARNKKQSKRTREEGRKSKKKKMAEENSAGEIPSNNNEGKEAGQGGQAFDD